MEARAVAGVLCLVIGVPASPAVAAAVPDNADGFPRHPLRYVVGGSVGGGADVLARGIAQKLAEQWRQQVIVDNRPGGGGIVASEIVARSPPDGYTLLMAFTSHVTNPSLYPKLPYDAVRDFAPVTLIATIPNVLVVQPALEAGSVAALTVLAKRRQLSYASTGSGASNHLAAVLYGDMAGVSLLHVPYKGAGPAITALLAGEVDLMFATMVSILPQVKSGRVRALGVTGARRSAVMADLPTLAEAGLPGYEANAWFATYTTAGTPPAVIRRLNEAIVHIVGDNEMRQRLAAQGAEALTSTPQALAGYTRDEIARWARVIRAAGARAE